MQLGEGVSDSGNDGGEEQEERRGNGLGAEARDVREEQERQSEKARREADPVRGAQSLPRDGEVAGERREHREDAP
jgi:hypothetical protein